MTVEKVALISAAGKGMGAAIARDLAHNGYRVALMSPSGSAVELAKELGGFGIAGSAWGTVLAQTGGAAAYVVMVLRGARRYGAPLRVRNLRCVLTA